MVCVHKLLEPRNWVAGVQWFFFIFANIVIIPITVGEAFGLHQSEIVPLLQLSFIVTGLACLAQAFFGHCRPIMEGQRSEEHTSELQSRGHLVCRLLLEKKK